MLSPMLLCLRLLQLDKHGRYITVCTVLIPAETDGTMKLYEVLLINFKGYQSIFKDE